MSVPLPKIAPSPKVGPPRPPKGLQYEQAHPWLRRPAPTASPGPRKRPHGEEGEERSGYGPKPDQQLTYRERTRAEEFVERSSFAKKR